MNSTIDFGIDLGTTNSSIALCRGGETKVFQSTDLMNVTPSVVYISKTGRLLVGKKAYDTWVQDPQNTQAEFKRWMGFSDKLTYPASGRVMSAEELSAEVLKALRADAARQTQEEITAAVITVPAAFSSLQCEATGRAAKLAGFEEAPLLQEPIAAAIAYGAGPASRNQRWMVFDLGGGTLDIAVVSTRNDRLAVLEHQGDNRLGGKDIDRIIADAFLLEPLGQTFALPDPKTDPAAYDRLYRALVRQAEQAKITLTSAPQVTVDLFDLGEDRDGKPIELSLTIARADVESRMTPLVERCLSLATRALEGARLSKTDLDRLLLVGGPTQMPVLRAALQSEIGAKLDHSLDPMTVVSQGAALYASTQPRTIGAAAAASAAQSAGSSSAIPLELHHERASGSANSPVAGSFQPWAGVYEVKVDADGGFWTSGWVAVTNGKFVIDVMLNDRKPATQFTVLARDKKGRALTIAPDKFAVAFMLPMAAPPLPHTIAVELTDTHGQTTYDAIFKRHCPLPAEARRSYKADRTLRPSDAEATLPIKFWEIEISDDPQERWWAGSVHVRADQIKRPIVEGSELELTIKIDASRKMTVEVFVPLLNESFFDGVFIPDPPTARSQLQQQLDLCFERLEVVRRLVYEHDRDDLVDRVRAIQTRLESIAEQATEERKRGMTDPDAALAPVDTLRKIRLQLAQLEEQLDTSSNSTLAREVRALARSSEYYVNNHGTESDKQELAKLLAQAEKYAQAGDPRGLKYVQGRLYALRGPILHALPSYWENWLNTVKQPGQRFLNQQEAQAWIAKAEAAHAKADLPGLRDAIKKVWELYAPDKLEQARDQTAQSGLRGT
jgi:molecular chaperone DnaK